jgi:hypothetical protein
MDSVWELSHGSEEHEDYKLFTKKLIFLSAKRTNSDKLWKVKATLDAIKVYEIEDFQLTDVQLPISDLNLHDWYFQEVIKEDRSY